VKAGQTDEALRVFEEALEVAHDRGEGRNVAELYRVKGELLLLRAGGDRSPELTHKSTINSLKASRHATCSTRKL
jgi:hypothetical protein